MIRPTVARVDLGALKSNYRAIVEHLARESADRPPGVIAVVKANAYGHGAGQVALALEAAGADLLACADIEEGAELRVPIVLLSQLSRAPESRSDHRPQLSDLRESGALEQDADVVAFIYREDMYMDKSQPPTDAQGIAELIVAKQRNGPTGIVKLAFIREYTRFENLATGAG